MATYQSILTSLNNGILTVTINRPEKLNALNKTVIEELGAVLDELYNDPAVKSAIITGSGPKAFVAGADISEFGSMDARAGKDLARRGQEMVFDRIENSPKPIVAAVNGFALGGGCELAMACHFRLCSENARFGQPEVSLGLIPGYGGTQRLTQLVGKGKAMELMLTGNMINAAEARELGLVNEVTPVASLLERTASLLQLINRKAPIAIKHIISLVNLSARGGGNGLQQEIAAFGELFDTKDAKEGAAAFLEKREPVFEGK